MRKIPAAILGSVSSLLISASVFATSHPTLTPIIPCDPGGQFGALCNSNLDFSKVIQTIISLLLIAAVVIALIFLIYGGIKWVISGGDKTAVEGARNHIVGAIVGLAIALAAFFIIKIIGEIFGIDLLKLKLPSFKP